MVMPARRDDGSAVAPEDARLSVERHYRMSSAAASHRTLPILQATSIAHIATTPPTATRLASVISRISAVVFLNTTSPDPAPDTYGGGALTFYGLLDDPRAQSVGLPLDATEGLLMTFPAEIVHSVAPVTHGERYTAVSWYR
jgi:hypothetical protein